MKEDEKRGPNGERFIWVDKNASLQRGVVGAGVLSLVLASTLGLQALTNHFNGNESLEAQAPTYDVGSEPS